MAQLPDSTALFEPPCWGLPPEAVDALGERLYPFWERFRCCFKTRPRDPSLRAYDYLRGQLTMDRERNFAHLDRTLHGGDGQATQSYPILLTYGICLSIVSSLQHRLEEVRG